MNRATIGACWVGPGACRFRVWAPRSEQVQLHLISPEPRLVPMQPEKNGFHEAQVEPMAPGARYKFRLNGEEWPDPASRFQPEGVHGPSEVVGPDFVWTDGEWFGLALRDYVIYELHVGAFSAEGTFDGVLPHLARLRELGVTALELLPVGQFPGERNWGYDGVYPFAPQNSYGGPAGLQRLVNACHRAGLAVVLDVVYNHLGPEGNYFEKFGPYLTDRYQTPWGGAFNFDGPDSGPVRAFFIQNALYWPREFHIDALRLDAVHEIRDFSAAPILEELAASVHRQAERLNRPCYVMAESDLNSARLVLPPEVGGYALDAQWSDDFHHALHVLLTGERTGYYGDYEGVRELEKCFREGCAYTGQYSRYRRSRRGSSHRLVRTKQLVVFGQNHDQVGNRQSGERLSALAGFSEMKLAAATVLLSPFIPLLLMGEEYGETAPFQYFTNHSDADLIQAVRQGRRKEFQPFNWAGEAPDPQAAETFARSRLNPKLREAGRHRVLESFYRELLRLRKELAPLREIEKEKFEVIPFEEPKALFFRCWHGQESVWAIFYFDDREALLPAPVTAGLWEKRLDSALERWEGTGSSIPDKVVANGPLPLPFKPKSVVLFLGQH